jgi:N-acetylmuramoyl-L-alanine amidase
MVAAAGSPAPSASPGVGAGQVEPAPGSDSAVYEPNPGAIVVAVDAGHGGCLDWGVADPSERGQEYSEKEMTLGIARRLRDLLEQEGITVVMIRDQDVALAGDLYPPLGCEGPPFRDVNGDGLAGFGPEVPEGTRTRDELQARLDLANLAGADLLVSIHINSPFDGGQTIEIAFSETFYTDETPWGPTATAALAADIQNGVVAALEPVADYERGDRGITAHNLYVVAPPLEETTPERPDPRKQPTRGGLMPVVLSEVGSITLRQEHDLLVSAEGQDAVARGLLDGITAYVGDRPVAARIGLADAPVGVAPEAVAGEGPPFWPPVSPTGTVSLRLTNTGTRAWPAGVGLVAGWGASDQPYLRAAPESLEPLDVEVPALDPGESIVVGLDFPSPPMGRAMAWITLATRGGETFADRGSPPLQLANQAP